MPIPKLSITLRNSHYALDRLLWYRRECILLDARHQHIISEMIMLRAFSILELHISEIAFKVASGACYTNTTQPITFVKCKSIAGARNLFLTFGRQKPIMNLKWTKAKYITDSVKYVIDENDFYIKNVNIHSHLINEMRIVRNVLAHRSKSARDDFRALIRTVYGAQNHITPGAYLATTRRGQICNIERYITSSKIILDDLCKGS
ncbi:hypothetical protein JK621_08790 [Serratia plymuthica]|uniref:hypothetical protein n=1 Tax=Serratia plymuthica TaxID=82996 RepID=UPI001BAF84B6|nr:hypothetical protein [Serratia plymuthica]QUY50224.1 hypothetical protein JK621_08790 [Serratia plymuthica]